jgi:alpha-glucosidase
MAWRNGVVYQIYPRSFQDSDGDGTGDLAGITARLDHLAWLGVDAVWISPFYPSPLADFGYDVSDYTDVDPMFGSMPDFDRLVSAAHERGLKVLLDLVACHTSIQHRWFRDHPEWYIWSEGDRPPNNWTSAFGGPAWSRYDERHWYLHSFYPEQPDLDWRNPEVVAAMQEVVRFWVARGADGFRLDAIDRLAKDPDLRDDPASDEPFGLPLMEHELGRDLRHSRNAEWIGEALAAIREAAGDTLLIGEVYLPAHRHASYLAHLDRSFVFELVMSPWEPAQLLAAIAAGAALEGRSGPGAAWALSNHDFGRFPSRFGRDNERAAALMLMTLPGTATLYQGDEIGMGIGPGGDPPYDRFGRDAFRHPMQWDGTRGGGFTSAQPWLPLVDQAERNVADQRDDPGSLLSFWRELIALRRELAPGFRMVDSEPGVIAYERGDQLVAINAGREPAVVPAGEVVLATSAVPDQARALGPGEGVLVSRT